MNLDPVWNLFWRASILLILAMAATLFVPRRFLAVRSAILRVCLIGLLLAPLAAFAPHLRIPVLPSAESESTPRPSAVETAMLDVPALSPSKLRVEPSPVVGRFDETPDDDNEGPTKDSSIAIGVSLPILTQLLPETSPTDASTFTINSQNQLAEKPREVIQSGGAIFQSAVTMAYLFGVVVLLTRLIFGFAKLHHLYRTSEPVESSAWIDDLHEYRRNLLISRFVELRSSSVITTPLTFGSLRPALIIPTSMIATSDALQRRVVLLHELTHVQRNDFIAQIAGQIAIVLYWVQPLAWILVRSLQATQEELCDAECAAEFGNETYSKTLIEIAKAIRIKPSLTLALAMSRTSSLSRRLTRIQYHLGEAVVRLSRPVACALGAVIIPLVIGSMFLDLVQAHPPEKQTDDKRVASRPDPDTEPDSVKSDVKGEPQALKTIDEPAKPSVDAASLRPEIKLPRIIFRLMDQSTKMPIANTPIKLRRLNRDRRPSRFDPETLEAKSDSDGVVAIPYSEKHGDQNHAMFQTDVGDKAIDLSQLAVQRTADKFALSTVSLLPGIEIVTRVFDADGQPASEARVQILADDGSPQMYSNFATCSADGMLRTRIPMGVTFGFTVTSDRSAPFRMVYPAGTQKVRDIRLSRGAVVSGQLIDRNGRPISHQEISLESVDTQAVETEYHVGRHGTGEMHLQYMRSTDEIGRYCFPPMTGSARIQLHEPNNSQSVTWESQIRKSIDQFVARKSKKADAESKNEQTVKKRVFFPGIQNRSREALGDLGDQIFQSIEKVVKNHGSFELANRKHVFSQLDLEPPDLPDRTDHQRRELIQAMERHNVEIDYYLRATITNADDKSEGQTRYQLTLELVDLKAEGIDKVSLEVVNGSGGQQMAGKLIPVDLNLPGSGDVWVPLMLSPLGTISGTVRRENGDPVKKAEVQALVPPRISSSYVTISEVKTDEDGHYELQVPFPIDEVHISCWGSGAERYMVHADPVDVANEDVQGNHRVIKRYVGGHLTINWRIASRKKSRDAEPPLKAIDPAWQPLADLELEIKNVMKEGKDSRQVMTGRCLEFEAQYRGTRMAIGALHFITRANATTISRKVKDDCLRAVEVMKDHYLHHPDVDLLITDFDAGSGLPGCEPLLVALSEESPFVYVRAISLLELAKQRFLLKSLKEQADKEAEESRKEKKGSGTVIVIKSPAWEVRNENLKLASTMDPDWLHQSALELLERVITGYPGVTPPVRYFRGLTGRNYPELMVVDNTERPTWRIRTPAEQAEILRFQKTRLQKGMKAPEIEGLDLHQQPIRLSQFRGKFVLLTLTLSNIEKELSAECARIVNALKDEEFVCVGVIPGQGNGGYSALAIIQDSNVTWPIIRDTAEDDIAHFWCQTTFPSMYLIDPQGTITSIDEGDHRIPGLGSRIRAQIKDWKLKQAALSKPVENTNKNEKR